MAGGSPSWRNGKGKSGDSREYITPVCRHGLKAEILTSHDPEDEGRKFFACSVSKYDDCHFAQWIDEPLPRSFCRNHCDVILRAEKEKYEHLLSCKDLSANHLMDELKMRNTEYYKLKRNYNELLKMRTQECSEYLKDKLDELKNMLAP